MITQQAQIKINLPLALKDFLASKAAKFDMPIASYVKHLILKDVENMEYPVFEASDKVNKAYKETKLAQHADKLIPVDDVAMFFDEL